MEASRGKGDMTLVHQKSLSGKVVGLMLCFYLCDRRARWFLKVLNALHFFSTLKWCNLLNEQLKIPVYIKVFHVGKTKRYFFFVSLISFLF